MAIPDAGGRVQQHGAAGAPRPRSRPTDRCQYRSHRYAGFKSQSYRQGLGASWRVELAADEPEGTGARFLGNRMVAAMVEGGRDFGAAVTPTVLSQAVMRYRLARVRVRIS